MNKFNAKQKIIAAIVGAYLGNLLASGLGELVGVDWNGGVWWDWILASLVVGTTISFPVALLLLYTLVPLIFKWLGFYSSSNLKKYLIVVH